MICFAGRIGRVGARPRRAASLRGELEVLRRDSGAGPEARIKHKGASY